MATSSGINYSCVNLGQEFFLPEVYLSSCDYAAFRGSMPAYFIDLLSSTHSQGGRESDCDLSTKRTHLHLLSDFCAAVSARWVALCA
ncbi:hypothetical protein EMIT0194MI4_10607 [Pseudomonas sp. IT-194MI4]